MLHLSRKKSESIVIGQGIVLTVLSVSRKGVVRLGVTAPREVPVLRGELLQPQGPPDPREK